MERGGGCKTGASSPDMAGRLTDAVIVGAGMAGPFAAEVLARNGLSVAVLEARNQDLDGSDGALALELGAEFIHGQPPEIFD